MLTKGQIISKCLFSVFNSPNNEPENSNFCPSLLGQTFFVHFLGELKTSKIPFEINWPLHMYCNSNKCNKLVKNSQKHDIVIYKWPLNLLLGASFDLLGQGLILQFCWFKPSQSIPPNSAVTFLYLVCLPGPHLLLHLFQVDHLQSPEIIDNRQK